MGKPRWAVELLFLPAYVSLKHVHWEHSGAVCAWGSYCITGKGVRNSSFWIYTWQWPIAQRKASLQCFISSLFAAFPGIIVLCSKMDNRLTVSSVTHEIQPSLILGIPKILAWNFAVAGARGKCVLHTEQQPVPASTQTVILYTIAGGRWEAGCKLDAGSCSSFLAARLCL